MGVGVGVVVVVTTSVLIVDIQTDNDTAPYYATHCRLLSAKSIMVSVAGGPLPAFNCWTRRADLANRKASLPATLLHNSSFVLALYLQEVVP